MATNINDMKKGDKLLYVYFNKVITITNIGVQTISYSEEGEFTASGKPSSRRMVKGCWESLLKRGEIVKMY